MYYTLFLIIFFSLLGATSVQAYFPKGSTWYDFYTLKKVSSGGETLSLDTPKDHIQVNEDIILERLTSSVFLFPVTIIQLHIRGGSIIPMQEPALTTNKTRMNPFSLLVGLDSQGSAKGDLYWDDGTSLTMTEYVDDEFIL